MKNDAIINNKKVKLSDKEVEAGAKFHLSRYPFAWINGELVFNDNENDDRDHQHWLCEDYNLTIKDWEKTPRGYMMEGKVQLFIGSDFRKMDMNRVTLYDLISIFKHYATRYSSKEVTIYNGVKVGKVGEIWPPIEKVTTLLVDI